MSDVSSPTVSFRDCYKAIYMLFCEEHINHQDGSVSFIRLIDGFAVTGLPWVITRMSAVIQLERSLAIPIEDWIRLAPEVGFELISPSGQCTVLDKYPLARPNDPKNPVTRIFLNVSCGISLSEEGVYKLALTGKTTGTFFQRVIERELPCVLIKTRREGTLSVNAPTPSPSLRGH